MLLYFALGCDMQGGSFENEALENEDRSTKHPNLENEAPKTRKRRPLNLENEAPKTRNHCRFNKCNFNFIISLTILDTSYLNMHFFGTHTCLCRLQNCPSSDFGLSKYAWAVTRKVWNEAENGVWGSRVLLLRHALSTFLLILRKNRLFCSLTYWISMTLRDQIRSDQIRSRQNLF